MPGIKATGIVIKQTEFGESNRMISIFTKEYGIIKASVYGAKSIKSSKGAASQFLCFSEFELSKGNSEIYTVFSADAKESFYPVSEDIEKLSLAVYLCDVTYCAVGQENKDEIILSLLLNTLYALSYNGVELRKAKCVYELKLMSFLGYRPILTKCVRCGNISNIVRFSSKDGGLICSKCSAGGFNVNKSVVEAMNYIISSEFKKMFSFKVTEDVLLALEQISEDYVKTQLDTEFSSLLYLKKIMI